MTLCMAMTDGTRTWIGADTRVGSGSWIFDAAPTDKFIPMFGWHVGFAGLTRLADLLTKDAVVTERVPTAFELVEIIRERWLSKGVVMKPDESNGCPSLDMELLLARPGEVWQVSGSLGVCQVSTDVWETVGSGAIIALGALCALETGDYSPEDMMAMAFEIATRYVPTVGGECRTKVLEP